MSAPAGKEKLDADAIFEGRMGWRFRRSVKIAPGVRWNIGAKSSSISIGGRGARVTVGSRGVTRTIGIPGTGLSFTERSGGSRTDRSAAFQFEHLHDALIANWVQKINLRALALSDRWDPALQLTLAPLRRAVRAAA